MSCLWCDEFLQTSKLESVYNFLKPYADGKNIGHEDRWIGIEKFGNINIYNISLSQHVSFYNFWNPKILG